MAILKVARLGHPVLRKKARELTIGEIRSPEIQRLIADMIETMGEYGGVGLAAPQVHESLQLAVIGYSDENSRYPGHEPQPVSVYINPKITVLDPEEQGTWEGCLSVPDLRGLVFRPRKIRVDYLDREGKSAQITAEGFLATVFQHELDHLAGILYVDKILSSGDARNFAFLDEYERYIQAPDQDLAD